MQFIYAIFGMKLEGYKLLRQGFLLFFRYWDKNTLRIHSPEHIRKSPALKKE